MEERYSFVTEWYDPHAALKREYQLIYYPNDKTCEMVDLKNKRLFLKRSSCNNLQLDNLFLGSVITIQSRQLKIIDFGDEFTRKKLQSKKEKTLGIIKPDCISKMADILSIVLEEGFTLCNMRMVTLNTKEASEFYAEHNGKPFFNKLVKFMSEGPIIAFEMIGENAVSHWRSLLGPTDPSEARQSAPSSIRAKFGTDSTRNACHGSDSITSGHREIEYFFGLQRHGQNTATYAAGNTLGIIKPDAIKLGYTGKILKDIEESGLSVTALALFNVEKANAAEFYEIYKGVVSEYTQMVECLSSGPCIALEITGENAQDAFRKLVGPPDPEIARHLRPHTLRAHYGFTKVENAVHCTDLPDDGILEIEYFFKILDH